MRHKLFNRIVIVVLLLAAVLGVASVSAQDDNHLLFIYWETGPEARPGWEKLMAGFNEANPDITVELRGIPGRNWTEYLNGLATAVAGGDTPDLMWVGGFPRLLVELDLIIPLDDYIERDAVELEEYLADVPPVMIQAQQVNGQQVMLPYSWNNMVIYYNTARFEEAGLEPPAENWTRDEFLETALALTDNEGNDGTTPRYGFAWNNVEIFTGVTPWIYANGGNIFSEDYCEATFDTPEVKDALQFLYDLIYKYKVAPAPAAAVDLQTLFMSGDIAMFGAGRWPLTNFVPANFTDYDIQYWPGNPDRLTLFGVDGFAIFKTVQNPEGAWTLIKYLTSKEVENALVGSVDSPLSNIPVRRSSAELMKDFPPANSAIFFESLESKAHGDPNPSTFNQMEEIVVRYTSAIFADEMSVEDGAKGAQEELSSIASCD